MQTHVGYLTALLLSIVLPTCISGPTSPHTSRLTRSSQSLSLSPYIQCDPRTKRPTEPTTQQCRYFLLELWNKASNEPPGAYRWYGRDLDPCDECVRLPSIIHYGHAKCAAVVDVDEEHEKDLSILGLSDLYEALHGVLSVCWMEERKAGRAFPDRQSAWTTFVEGPKQGKGFSSNETVVLGDRVMSILDLRGKWTEHTIAKGNGSTVSVDIA